MVLLHRILKFRAALLLLIYNAREYRQSDALRAAGYEPLTQAIIEEAHRTGAVIECLGGLRLRTAVGRDKVYAFKPRNAFGR